MHLLRFLAGCCALLWAGLALPAPALCGPEITILYTAETNGRIEGCSV